MKMRRSLRCAAAIVALAITFVSAPVLRANKKPPLQPVNFEYRNRAGVAASSRNWAVDGRQNPENAQVVWPVQKRGRSARDQRNRSEAHGKNAQVRHCRQKYCAEKAVGQRSEIVNAAIHF